MIPYIISLLYLGRSTPSIILVENSCEYCEIFKNSFFYRTPLLAASEMNYSSNQDRYYHLHLPIHSLFLHDGITVFIWYESFVKLRQTSIQNKIPVIHSHNVNEIKVYFYFMHGPENMDIHMTV